MAQVEIEFKNLLTKTEFERLLSSYSFASPFQQTNYYFDTPDQQLKQHHCGLRIRRFADHAEQTLKQPTEKVDPSQHQLIETTDVLTLAQARTKEIQPHGEVAAALKTRGLNVTDLQLFAEATTTRRIASLAEGELTLDQTTYPNGHVDYELELETSQPQLAQTFYQRLLQRFQIPPRKVTNKIQRAVTNHIN